MRQGESWHGSFQLRQLSQPASWAAQQCNANLCRVCSWHGCYFVGFEVQNATSLVSPDIRNLDRQCRRMALTLTRTRTHTALTKMSTLLANLNGELEFVRALLEAEPVHQAALATRETVLQQKREAVMATIRQVDPNIDPEDVGTADGWRKQERRNLIL